MRVKKQAKKRPNIWIYIFILIIVIISYQIFFSNYNNTEKNSNSIYNKNNAESLNNNIDKMKKYIVYITYEFSGKKSDGSFFINKTSGSGIIFYVNNSIMQIFTNRHIIDCNYNNECYQRFSETINIRTPDSKIYEVSKIMLAPHNLDIAVLEIKINGTIKYPSDIVRKNKIQLDEEVISIGYPTLPESNKVLEFTISKGKITNFRDLITSDGFYFKGIDSDAYTNYGGSGGGLFDTDGNLIGINTWIQKQGKKSIAININIIDDFSNYYFCEKGSYPTGINNCLKSCTRDEILGSDNLCYKQCKSFYCKSEEFNVNDSRCKKNLILGYDGACHQPCESISTYCIGNNYCYKNKCINCLQTNTYLFENGNCRFIE